MSTNIQLLRSSVAYKRPSAAPLLEGQVALNFNATEPGLFFRLTNGQLSKVGPVSFTDDGTTPNSAPAGETGNSVGEEWMNAQPALYRPILHVYDGNSWQTASGFKVDAATGDFTLERVLNVNTLNTNDLEVSGSLDVGGNITPNGQNCAYFLGKPGERWDYAYLCNSDITYDQNLGRNLTVGGLSTFNGNAKFMSYIESGLIPLGGNHFLGTVTDRWQMLGAVQADLSGNLTVGGTSEFIGRIVSHLIPDTAARALGAPASPWSDLYVNNVSITNDLVVGGNLTVNGEVTSNLLPGGNFNLGSAGSRWDYGYFNNLDASQSFKCAGVVTSNFKPDGGNRQLGTTSNRWSNVYTGDLSSTGVAVLSGDIKSSGKFSDHASPKVTNTYDLGTTALRWRKSWLVNGDVSGQVKAPAASSPTGGDYLVNKDYVDTKFASVTTYWEEISSLLSPKANNQSVIPKGTANLGTSAARWNLGYFSTTNTVSLNVTTSVVSNLMPNGSVNIGSTAARWNIGAFNTVETSNLSGCTVKGNLTPDANNTRELGSSASRWKNVYGVGLNATTLTATNVGGFTLTGSIVPNTNNAHSIGSDPKRIATLFSINVKTTNFYGTTLKGDIVPDSNNSRMLGTNANRLSTVYAVTLNSQNIEGATVKGSFTPNTNNAHDLGSSSNKWKDVWAVNLNTNNLSGCTVTGSIIPNTNNTHNLGSSANRFANVYTGDLHLKNDRGDWVIVEEEEYLSIKNNKNGKTYKFVLEEIG